jgi:hypothetical protein
MSLITKIEPQEIDRSLDLLQKYLYNKLTVLGNHQSYPRVYKNPKQQNGDLPEHYKGKGDYEDTLYSDKFDATTFFIAEDEMTPNENGKLIQRCSWIVQVKILKIFNIPHRGDAELRNEVLRAFQEYKGGAKFVGAEWGIDNVYREFDRSNVKFDDMSGVHVLRINFDQEFSTTCCINCN